MGRVWVLGPIQGVELSDILLVLLIVFPLVHQSLHVVVALLVLNSFQDG